MSLKPFFAETDRAKLLDLIVTAIREHLNCSNVAYYQVEMGKVSIIHRAVKCLPVDNENFATQLVNRVDADGDPIVINATGYRGNGRACPDTYRYRAGNTLRGKAFDGKSPAGLN